MKLGILREEKIPVDRRTPFSPSQCKRIINDFPNIEIYVQSCKFRCYSDHEYLLNNISVLEDISFCDILFGIKEVPIDRLISHKTYFFFSHTIKKQAYNRDLLKKMISLNIRMIDYEVLKFDNGKRILGFGRYAGIIGAYNGLLTYGLKTNLFNLKPAHLCFDRKEMDNQLKKVILKNEKLLVTGKGRVGKGILETLIKLNVTEVNQNDYLTKEFNYPVFLNIDVLDYNERIDKKKSNFLDFINNYKEYKSSFMKFVSKTTIYFAGHFYANGAPYLFTREDVRSKQFNISVIADVSCDIDGPVATTIRASKITDPIYGYNKLTEDEDDFMRDDVVAVMAVDNLPCELPKDASKDFGENLIKYVIPILHSNNSILEGATICKDGDLTQNFEYLRDFINA
ncbi:MAG: alanine dehydrogenase [Flavobacteriales bacterium]|nr:alanine dehydrogenase [Flavobacteriales bacterium]